jgi:SAM-dependent methyltransferase
MSATLATRARSFDAWAPAYDAYRPGYPPELFDTIASRLELGGQPRVVDLGAGTGRASIAMARRGWRVTAVEPGRPMLDVLRAQAAHEKVQIATVEASAEATRLDPASVDLAVAAQAFHWFDADRALAEMSRIVRPGGGIALFWNVRDASRSALVADYHQLLNAHGVGSETHTPGDRDLTTRRRLVSSATFDAPSFVQIPHLVEMSADAFVGLAFTSSYVRVLPAEAQRSLGDALTRLVERHVTDGPLGVPYVVDCWIAHRSGR